MVDTGPLLVDHRERGSSIPEALVAAGLDVRLTDLPVGDYVLGLGLAVERKGSTDLGASIRDGRIFDEAWETALALGIGIDVPDPVELVRAFGAQLPAAKPSALLDVEAGRVSEIAVVNGAVPREAAKVGRTAPVNATLTALVRARESRS